MCLKKKKSLESYWVKIAAEYKIDQKQNKQKQNQKTNYGSICGETEPQVISEGHARSPLAQGRKRSRVQGKQTMAPVCSQSTGWDTGGTCHLLGAEHLSPQAQATVLTREPSTAISSHHTLPKGNRAERG